MESLLAPLSTRPTLAGGTKEEAEEAQKLGATPVAMRRAKSIPELELRRIRIARDLDENQVVDLF